MARSLTINGTERIGDLLAGTLEVEAALTYELDTCQFSVRGVAPAWGQEVIVEDDDLGRVFAGTVVKVVAVWDPVKELNTYQVDCDDYTTMLAAKRVTERYEGMTASAVFQALADKYAPAFTIGTLPTSATDVGYLDLLEIPLPDAFTMVCEATGCEWWPDYFKALHFISGADLTPAPFTLEPGGAFTGFKYAVDLQGMKNRITVRGGTAVSDDQYTFTRQVTSQREWTLPHIPRMVISLTLDGEEQLVGWDGIDDEASVDFLVNPNAYTLKVAEGYVIEPAQGEPARSLVFTFRYEVPVIVVVDDLESQALMASYTGTDGIYEGSVIDNNITSLTQALATGQAELDRWANPRTGVTFKTHRGDWRPGQIVSVDLPDRAVQDDFQVQAVKVESYTEEHWMAEVVAGSSLFGLAYFLAKTLKRQARPEDAGMVHKVQSGSSAFTLDDSSSAGSSVAAGPAEVGTAEVGWCEL